MHAKLQLTPRQWYGWQMLPGYVTERKYLPYFSPIWIQKIIPRKTGRKILTLRFINVLYAEGVQDFALDLRILKHETNYLVSEILSQGHGARDRTAIISHIGFDWIQHFLPSIWTASHPSSFGTLEQESVSHYLKALFQLPD